MTMASTPATTSPPLGQTALGHASVDPAEAAHFGTMAAEWWNPRGSSAMLHRLNPVRLRYLREQVDLHWRLDDRSFTPLAGKTALDVGCGAGLLCEPLARLGATVTGIDAAPENIAAARIHAAGSGLAIEHVTDPASFVRGLANALAPGGLLILSTPNRTPLSRLALITFAEGMGQIPRGTHDWDKFLTPDELTPLLEAAGLRVIDTRGLAFSPARGFVLSDDTTLDYFLTAVRA